MSLRIFILGGGRFGTHLASRLCEFGCEVVIADSSPKRVEDLSEDGFHAVELDADDEEALRAAGAPEADAVVVSIGENMQASILATLTLKELKAKKVVARAVDIKHAQVLEKVGADLVVLPSRDMAYQLAETLRAGSVSERRPISGEYQLAYIRAGRVLDRVKLSDAQLPGKYRVTVVLISRDRPAGEAAAEDDAMENFEPEPDFVLQFNDLLAVTGRRTHIDRFEQKCGRDESRPD
ncbi:MAG TPA: TrkA family potassium uptake protein [Verrucomicrobiae bacterium]|nr:TrkA family potassium uptake protein [Verrucomicrobiae bacterium]